MWSRAPGEGKRPFAHLCHRLPLPPHTASLQLSWSWIPPFPLGQSVGVMPLQPYCHTQMYPQLEFHCLPLWNVIGRHRGSLHPAGQHKMNIGRRIEVEREKEVGIVIVLDSRWLDRINNLNNEIHGVSLLSPPQAAHGPSSITNSVFLTHCTISLINLSRSLKDFRLVKDPLLCCFSALRGWTQVHFKGIVWPISLFASGVFFLFVLHEIYHANAANQYRKHITISLELCKKKKKGQKDNKLLLLEIEKVKGGKTATSWRHGKY